jgi:hypothetical protein
MKTGFNDPIAPKSGKKKKSPWDYQCPEYDERSSCYVHAGSNFGIGHRNPIGHDGAVKQRVATMPFGRVNTMQVAYAPPKALEQEYIE